MKLRERFNLWLCRIGWHSWVQVAVHEAMGDPLAYIEIQQCCRCLKRRNIRWSEWDQMGGI